MSKEEEAGAAYTPTTPDDVPASAREAARMLFAAGLGFQCETRVVPERRWRFDIELVDHPIALEIDGGVYGRHGKPSGHTTYAGYRSDRLKDATAMAERGVYVYRTTTDYSTIRQITELVIRHAKRLAAETQ